MKFTELDLKTELIEHIQKQEFEKLTDIQEKCIPEILQKNDVVGQAETGSGKTLAFVLPLLTKIYPGGGLQVLVLTPTRELCVQVSDVFRSYGNKLGIHVASIYGGVSIGPQLSRIRKSEVVVGTPGRLLDLSRRKAMKCEQFDYIVIDETDKLFEMGFIEDVEKIIHQVKGKRQTLMFSATISKDIQKLMKKHQKNPVVIRTKSQVDRSKLKQTYYDLPTEKDKFSLLVHLLKHETKDLAIVFCATRIKTDVVSKNLLTQKINSAALHGGMTQRERLKTLESLRKNQIHVLVATDVAARGLDIKNISHIYNYDVPPNSIEYIHRIGRTARAGNEGSAVTLLTRKDSEKFKRLNHGDISIKRTNSPEYKLFHFNRDLGQKRNLDNGNIQKEQISKSNHTRTQDSKRFNHKHPKQSFSKKYNGKKSNNHPSNKQNNQKNKKKEYNTIGSKDKHIPIKLNKRTLHQRNTVNKNRTYAPSNKKKYYGKKPHNVKMNGRYPTKRNIK